MNRRPLFFVAIAAAALATAAVAFAGQTGRSTAVVPAPLSLVKHEVDTWLMRTGFTGFHVAEVMAFTNNDYAAVIDPKGHPAFEVIVAPDATWLMEEPASMMWNAKYGMFGHIGSPPGALRGMGLMMGGAGMIGGMSGWYGVGHGKVTTLARAVSVANGWLAETRPGETAESDGRAFPGYYTLDTTAKGKTVGMLSVNASSGAVWYHGWHGKFVAEKMFAS